MSASSSRLPINADDLEWLKLDNQLCFRLYTASKAITRAYRSLLEPLGLTYPQYLVMLVLWQRLYENADQEVSIKDIGAKLNLDTGTLTPLLKRLESSGYLQRTRSDSDERRVLLSLTAEGIALSKQARDVPHSLFCQLDLPVEFILQLAGHLDRLIATLDADESRK